MHEPKYWQDLAGTIPAEVGDRVALVTNVIVNDTQLPDMHQPDETKRPTIAARTPESIWPMKFDGWIEPKPKAAE